MYREKKAKRMANCLSVLLHLVIFIAIASSGLFMRFDHTSASVVDVVIYDEGGSGGEAGGGEEAIEEEAPAAGDIVVKSDAPALKKPAEDTKREVKKEEKPRREEKAQSALAPAAKTAATGGKGGGLGEAEGGGRGDGSQGDGSGGGQGSGNGDGSALAPKTPPSLIVDADPRYPENLRRQGVEGRAKVRMLVGADGSVENVEIVESSRRGGFDDAAVDAAYRCVFSPAKNAYGDAVRCYIYRSFNFKIR